MNCFDELKNPIPCIPSEVVKVPESSASFLLILLALLILYLIWRQKEQEP